MPKQTFLFPKDPGNRKKHIYTMDHIEDGYESITNTNMDDAFTAMIDMYYKNPDNGLVAPSITIFKDAMQQSNFYEITDFARVARRKLNP